MSSSFVRWLGVPPGRRWLDVGCGTGAVAAAVLEVANPAQVVGVDPSHGFVAVARVRVADPRVRFAVGDAGRLGLPDADFHAAVGGLMLNFVPDPGGTVSELARVTAPGGVVAAYVWDYADGMQMLRTFWDAAVALDPAAAAHDEGRRFPLCRPEPLRALWVRTGLVDVAVEPIDVTMDFRDFDEYWMPYLGGQGPAPGYVISLSGERRAELRALLRDRLPTRSDGSIVLAARAWAVRGRRPAGPRGER